MNVFNAYADYYDLLYKDKDYSAEADYVDQLIKQRRPGAMSILNMGCGTGMHDFFFAEKGYHIIGVDRSEKNIKHARSKCHGKHSVPYSLDFRKGDIRYLKLNQAFDAVISLFHVMSYQTTNADLSAAFASARSHITDNGVFIFDCWYGPAVLSDPPCVRVKTVENNDIRITRIAEPEILSNDNIVNVNYRIIIKDKQTEKIKELKETHRMRYLFTPEIKEFLNRAGFVLVESAEWMTGKSPGLDTWNICFTAKAST